PDAPASNSNGSGPDPMKNRRHWARIAGWIVGGVTVLLLFVIVAVALMLRSVKVHDYLLRLPENKASQSLGTQVKLQNFAIHPSNLSIDLYGLTVSGADPYPNPSLLFVRHVEVVIRVISVLSRKWYLDTVSVEDPVVRIIVDKNGVSNIPKPKSNSSDSHIDIF